METCQQCDDSIIRFDKARVPGMSHPLILSKDLVSPYDAWTPNCGLFLRLIKLSKSCGLRWKSIWQLEGLRIEFNTKEIVFLSSSSIIK